MYWKKVTKELKTKNKRKQFNSLTSNTSRIQFLYYFCEKNVKYDLSTSVPKDFEGAKALEDKGNKLFRTGDNSEAINVYNEAIKICPQDNLKSLQLYGILIEKRSSVFFAQRKYHKGLQDVAFLKQYGYHPNLKIFKSRETKALEALRKSGCEINNINNKSNEIINEEMTWYSGNITYPALSNKLTVKQNDIMGRHVVAMDDIKTGEIIAVEVPYASVIENKTNCAHCAISTNQIYACFKCQEIYCSLLCLENAKVYHEYECSISSALFTDNLGYVRLALRMVTQRPLAEIIQNTDDYYNVNELIQHEDAPESEEMLQVTFTAVFLLKLLKTTNYFTSKTKNKELTKEEVMIGELFLKYLKILRHNAHAIREMQNYKMAENSVEIGVGLYPTIALFNHSCDPSVIKYNINNLMVLRSIKPIKTGDIVYDNYGPAYFNIRKDKRINLLKKYYRFTCNCQACIEDWPLFKEISLFDNNILIKHQHSSISSVEEHLNLLLLKLNQMEDPYLSGHFESARKLYAEILDTLLSFFTPLNVNIHHIQQRLKYCIQHRGNKKIDF